MSLTEQGEKIPGPGSNALQERALILMGGNFPNSSTLFNLAGEQVTKLAGRIVRSSAIYQSKAWGFESCSLFINKVVEVATNLEPAELLATLLAIETRLGRTRGGIGIYTSRGIDLDILFYGNRVINTRELVIPHPRLHLRRFALEPLNESWPFWVDPATGKRVCQLLAECTDKGPVTRLD